MKMSEWAAPTTLSRAQALALAALYDYTDVLEENPDYAELTAQDYVRKKMLELIDPAIEWAMDYAYTNGGL
jgi:hypothetical protein